MTGDQHNLITDAIFTLKNYEPDDTVEDLTLLIQQARETLEQVMHIEEDERMGSYVKQHIKRKYYD